VLTPKELAAAARGESPNGHRSLHSPTPTDVPDDTLPRPMPGSNNPGPGTGGLDS
jgi:hypothetical protein